MSGILETTKSSNSNNCSSQEYDNSQEQICTTPIRSKKLMSRELNDFYISVLSQCTQEDCDNIDVVWDWYSPKSKPKIFKQKRVVQQSPKLTVKRQPSNNQLSAFNKLKEELETLNDEATVEKNLKIQVNLSPLPEFNDVFNDSMEEQLIMCSQEVEHNIGHKKTDFLNKFTPKDNNLECDVAQAAVDQNKNEFADDSFDYILETLRDEDLGNRDTRIPKVESNSFEAESDKISKTVSSKDNSPIKCSPREIEQKRLLALAKLQAKRRQDIIEQNRQKALKRLEISKKRRALKVQTMPPFR